MLRNTVLWGAWSSVGKATPPPHESPGGARRLAAEAVQGAALALQGVHDVHGSHRLAASVLGVGHRVTDDVLQEDLQDTAGLVVDETADALHTATASQTADGGLGDALDVVAKYATVALGAALAVALAALSTSDMFTDEGSWGSVLKW